MIAGLSAWMRNRPKAFELRGLMIVRCPRPCPIPVHAQPCHFHSPPTQNLMPRARKHLSFWRANCAWRTLLRSSNPSRDSAPRFSPSRVFAPLKSSWHAQFRPAGLQCCVRGFSGVCGRRCGPWFGTPSSRSGAESGQPAARTPTASLIASLHIRVACTAAVLDHRS